MFIGLHILKHVTLYKVNQKQLIQAFSYISNYVLDWGNYDGIVQAQTLNCAYTISKKFPKILKTKQIDYIMSCLVIYYNNQAYLYHIYNFLGVSMFSKTEIKNKPDPLGLYIKNAKATFFGGYPELGRTTEIRPNEGDAIQIILHTLMLPITTTLGAGAFTCYQLYQFSNRKLLSDEDVENLKLHLNNISPEQFDQIVMQIIKKPVSTTDDIYDSTIYDLTIQLQNRLESYESRAKSSCVELKRRAHEDYRTTKEDEKRIDNELGPQYQEIYDQKRILQKEAIISYISTNLIAGSKMANDMNDMVNKSYSCMY